MRYPTSGAECIFYLDYLIEITRLAEYEKFDNVFFADVFGSPIEENSNSTLKLDPIVIISALAAVTKNIGLTGTLTTTYNEPFHVARKYNSIDHLSKGRAPWNVVSSYNSSESLLFGQEKHLEHSNHYERAEEFVDVVKKLWFSIEDEALVIDKEKGKYLDLEKVHPVNHEGKFFKVQGTLDSPSHTRSSSNYTGRFFRKREELAAKTADVIFTAWQTLEEAQAFYRDVKGRLAKYGRQPDDLKVMPGLFITVAETEEEAKRKQKALNNLILPEVGLSYLSNYAGFDLTGYDIEAPFPENFGTSEDSTDPQIRPKIIKAITERENLTTLRQVYEHIGGARGHREIVGTPEQIVDQLEDWFINDGADGFNIMPPHLPEVFTDIVELVIPELQSRGLFRTEYEGNTLRGNSGLSVPVNPYKKKAQTAGK